MCVSGLYINIKSRVCVSKFEAVCMSVSVYAVITLTPEGGLSRTSRNECGGRCLIYRDKGRFALFFLSCGVDWMISCKLILSYFSIGSNLIKQKEWKNRGKESEVKKFVCVCVLVWITWNGFFQSCYYY